MVGLRAVVIKLQTMILKVLHFKKLLVTKAAKMNRVIVQHLKMHEQLNL